MFSEYSSCASFAIMTLLNILCSLALVMFPRAPNDLEEEEVTTVLQRIEAYLLIHNQYDEL